MAESRVIPLAVYQLTRRCKTCDWVLRVFRPEPRVSQDDFSHWVHGSDEYHDVVVVITQKAATPEEPSRERSD